jgi:hypothetical protein
VVARTRLDVTFIPTLRVLFIVPVVYEPFTHKQECIATLVLYEAEALVTQHLSELIFPPVQHTVESASGEPFLLFTKLVFD